MAEIKLTKSELDNLVSNAQKTLDKILAKEEGSAPPPKEGSAGPSAGPSASPSPSGPPAGPSSDPANAAPEGAGDAGPPAGGPPPDAAPGAGAPGDPAAAGGEQGVDPQALKAEYAKLDPQSLEMHYLAAKEALYEKMQQSGAAAGPGAANPAGAPSPSPMPSAGPSAPPAGPGAGGPPPGGPSAGPAGGPPPGGPPGGPGGPPPEALKSEKDAGAKLAKFEADLEKLKGENGLLHKAVEMLSAPLRKSLTGTSFAAKPGTGTSLKKSVSELTKAEVDAIIKAKAMDASLSKKDRELMVDYRLGSGDLKSIAHLLTDAK